MAWHLPPGTYGQTFADETLVYPAAGPPVSLTGKLARAWQGAAEGWPVPSALAERLCGRGLLQRRQDPADADAAADLSLPASCAPAADVRWRRELPGSVYLARTQGEWQASWLTEPLATFWEQLALTDAPQAHAATQRRFGEAWRGDDAWAALGEWGRRGLLREAPAARADAHAWRYALQPDVEDVSVRVRSVPVPWYLQWEITYACNLTCRTCYTSELYGARRPSLDRAGAEHWLGEIERAGVFHVTLTGGEPFALPLLADMCARLKQRQTYVKIVSNGTLTGAAKAEQLARLGVNQVDVSLDGFSPETNDPVRGEGSFEAIRRGVRAVLAAGIPRVSVSVTLGAHNFDELADLPRLAHETLGVRDVFVTRMLCAGRGREHEAWKLSLEQTARLRERLEHEWPERYPDVRVTTQRWHCDCGRTRCVLSPEGLLRTCTFHGSVLGDARQGLLEQWRTAPGFDQVRRPYRYNQACTVCADQLTCQGTACSARVWALDGKLLSDGCVRDAAVLERYGE